MGPVSATADTAGPRYDERMSDVDALVWAVERDPRLRSTVSAVAVLDGPLDRLELWRRLDRASRRIPRLRQRVVPDPYGIAPPRWEIDPDFRLAAHVRITGFGGRGTDDDLHRLAAAVTTVPFDRARPLWEFTLVEGLTGDRTALVMKTHHAVTDGVGGVQLMLEIFDLEPHPDDPRRELPPEPEPDPPRSEPERVLDAVAHEARRAAGALESLVGRALGVGDPVNAARHAGETAASLGRLLAPAPEPLSPIMTGRSGDLAFAAFDVPLTDLKAAGHRIGGTVNDAFVAGVLAGVAAYHGASDAPVERLRLSIPLNRRRPGDTTVGNRWTPARAVLRCDIDDPDELMRHVHETVDRLRREPAQDLLDPLAGVLRLAPAPVATSLFAAASRGVDVAASNVPGSPVPLWLLGRRLTALVPFGPLSGCAANITLLSIAGTAHIGVVVDPAAVPDVGVFTRHLRDGFSRVVDGRR